MGNTPTALASGGGEGRAGLAGKGMADAGLQGAQVHVFVMTSECTLSVCRSLWVFLHEKLNNELYSMTCMFTYLGGSVQMSLYFSLKYIEKYNGWFEGHAAWKTHCLEDTCRVRLQQETPAEDSSARTPRDVCWHSRQHVSTACR